jgi:hypothetical protein
MVTLDVWLFVTIDLIILMVGVILGGFVVRSLQAH